MDMAYWMLLFYVIGTIAGGLVFSRFWLARGAEKVITYLIENGYLISVIDKKGEIVFIKPELREE